ncbi:MAG: 3-deoxy-D-manno-octulosonic acid transferase [Hyphomicrobiales bacterium]|nr:MAG: 3-deoxy-D-manno-octulosonic acid transferase [Hyphomicrobiales bacterium]
MTDRLGHAYFRIYRAVSRVVQPAAGLIVKNRLKAGKEDPDRYREKLGQSGLERPAGVLIWVHAASVGETNAILPMLSHLQETGARVLLTTGTLTSASIAKTRMPHGAMHQFMPFDFPKFVERFLDFWKPDLAIFVESEIWPNTIFSLRKRKVPIVQINGRMSDRSFTRWQKIPAFSRAVFGAITLCMARGKEDSDRFIALGVSGVSITGNLKFDVPPPEVNREQLEYLRGLIGSRPVWLAASTHPGEEDMVVDVHRMMLARMPDLLTIIVPRHPGRGAEIRTGLGVRAQALALRSEGAVPDEACSIYCADTLGELGLFYSLCSVAFLGGSLIEHGGQNPIEAARLGCAVIHGPHTQNFREIYDNLNKSGAAEKVLSRGDLHRAVQNLLSDPNKVHLRKERALETLQPFSGALDRSLMAMQPLLKPIAIDAALNGAHYHGHHP